MLALKIDEYVPLIMPTSRATAKSRVLEPPNSASAVKVKRTVSDVLSDRPSVWSKL